MTDPESAHLVELDRSFRIPLGPMLTLAGLDVSKNGGLFGLECLEPALQPLHACTGHACMSCVDGQIAQGAAIRPFL